MKKIIVVLLAMVAMISFSSIVSAESSTSQLYIHYYRYAEDYTDWNVWVWQEEPSSLEGQGYDFETDDTALSDNFGGVVAKIDLDVSLPDATEVGLIVRKGNWAEKDIDANRYVEIPDTTESGIFHVYLVEGDQRIGTSIDDVDGPDKSPKFKTAYFVELDTIRYTATEELASTDITIYEDNIAKTPTSVTIDGNAGTIILPFELDFSKEYKIEAVFQDSSVNDFEITYDGIYDSEEFELAFAYTGDDLGAYPSDLKTTFRLWAPVSEQVVLNLYDTGTPLQFGGTDTPTKTVAMTPDIKGTFYHEEVGNLHGTYYTYSVTNGDMTSEVVDPYAKSTGINGLRGLIVDFDQVNPSGFTYDSRPDNMTNATDAIIYELHVRDLTTHSSWNGTEANRGKYLGLVESGTTFEGATTGFDHMVELGITHVQILPFFDFGVLDETKIDEEDYQPFNWGYMPLNFNALEGSYSADPYDGLERIKEMKEVVTAFTEAGIRVNMDVVYNHTGETANSNFNLIVPGYYHRKTANGAFANGSGTGNETASDRYMMQKFMVDSVVFWATEYNISGFRFDLMALHDVETMNLIATELKAIDQTIMVYGEPWKGFSESPLDSSLQAGKFNLDQMPDVGAFNDDLRDAVKGSVFLADEGGFVQGNNSSQIITRVKYGITGGVAFPGVSGSSLTAQKIWHTEPTKTINYVTAHDNNTLYDKLYQTLEEDGLLDLIPAMSKQANAIVLTSQGVAFLHAGDEILRSKPLAEGFDHNSYQSPDSVNQIRWNLKTTDTGEDVFEYYKGLIELRKSHPSFRMPTATEIIDNMAFLYEDKEGLIAYTIVNDDSLDAYDTILVAHNASDDEVKVRLPKDGGWVLIVDGDDAGTEQLSTYLGGSKLTITPHSSYVLYQDQSIEDYNPWPTIILSSVGGLIVLGAAGAALYFFVIRKRV